MWKHQYNLDKMLLILAVLGGGVAVLSESLEAFFFANAVINGVILGVLVIGIMYAFRTVSLLRGERKWLERMGPESMGPESMGSQRMGEQDFLSEKFSKSLPPPRLTMILANFYDRLMQARQSGETPPVLSADLLQAILHSVESRLSESRETLRYFVGLLIFLGLLGTFWGLLDVLASISQVVGNLNPIAGDENVFTNLRESLTGPLAGMGTAFSSSLFGLGGSLILGFFALQAGQAQNRFYNDLEIFLSRITTVFSRDSEAIISTGEAGDFSQMAAQIAQLSLAIQSLSKILPKAGAAKQDDGQSFEALRKLTVAQAEWLERLVKSQLQLERNISALLPELAAAQKQMVVLEKIQRAIDDLQKAVKNGHKESSDKICKDLRALSKSLSSRG